MSHIIVQHSEVVRAKELGYAYFIEQVITDRVIVTCEILLFPKENYCLINGTYNKIDIKPEVLNPTDDCIFVWKQ